MPYIEPSRRPGLDAMMAPLKASVLTSGDLNYVISNLLINHIRQNGVCYNEINNAVGVLECVKLELYRRVAVPYEDLKIKQNGDVL